MIRLKRYYVLCFLWAVIFFCACQSETQQLKKAYSLYQQGLELSFDNSAVAAETYNKALHLLDRCDQTQVETQRLKGQIEDQLGLRYYKLGLKEEALRLHLDAVEIFRSLPGSVLLLNALQNAGRVAASLHRMDEAKQYYEEALQVAITQSDKKIAKDILLETGREVYMENGEYEKAIEVIEEAKDGGASPDLCRLTLGMAYYHIENIPLAIEYLNMATQSEKASVRMSAYHGLYQIHESQKDYQKALRCYESYNENMVQENKEQRNEEIQRIKKDGDLQMQKNTMQAMRKLKRVYLYMIIGWLLFALGVTLLLFRQKTLKDRFKEENSQFKEENNRLHMDVAMRNNKVFLTAMALSEKIAGNPEDFNLQESEWNEYLELIDLIYNGFTKRLLECYPALTKTDLQICALTRQGYSNQVISAMMNMQTNSYARRKSRIKQEKMNGLEDDRSFEEIINSL